MGASPYFYLVDFETSISESLASLRSREFQAGRYNPVMPMPPFPVTEDSPSPGAGHDSIQDAMEDAEEEGTRSILDIESVSASCYGENEYAFGTVSPLSDDMLQELFGTTQPTVQQIEENLFDIIGDIERGMGIYVIGYAGETPEKVLFAGYSYD